MYYTDNPERDMEFDQMELENDRKHKSLLERLEEHYNWEEKEDGEDQ